MFAKILCFALLLTCVVPRYMPRFEELEEEDQMLWRAAYDTPNYDHEEEDMSPGKLHLLKDGMWLIKTKLGELKAFDKALLANLLSTKMKLKHLLKNKKKHHDVQTPSHHNDNQNSGPAYYEAPADQYVQPPAHYAPAPQYAPHYAPQYAPPAAQHYGPPPPPAPQYAHDPYYGL